MYRIHDIEERVEEASRGFSLSMESVLQQGFNLFRKAPGPLIVYALIAAFIWSNPLSGLLLGGPAIAGYYLAARRLRDRKVLSSESFLGGMEHFVPLVILQLLITLLVSLGLILLVIPGIYFAVSYIFAQFFVVFYGVEGTRALRLSRLMVSGNFGQVLLLCLVLLGINLLGVLALGMGLLLSMPLSACILFAAFDDIIGIPKD